MVYPVAVSVYDFDEISEGVLHGHQLLFWHGYKDLQILGFLTDGREALTGVRIHCVVVNDIKISSSAMPESPTKKPSNTTYNK
jgi:hypothetical protein